MAGSSAGKPAGFVDSGESAQDGAGRLLQRLHGNAGGTGKGHGLAGGASQQGNGADGTSALANGATDAAAAGGASGARADSAAAFDFKMFAAMQEARGPQTAKAPEPVVALALSATEKRGNERTESAKATTDATYSGAPVGTSSNGYSVNGSAEVAPAPDMQAAEQVKYWISQDVQNAELKLDGLGDKPVEVSISINGNEAHVAFRTDEIQTRDVLESAGIHLKDMLAREGLLLSGVSVGTSGANDGGGNERKPRQGMKQGLVNAAPVGGVDTAKMARGSTGRSLDLFV
jgi:flagellar hook-length control protein FliK